MYFQYFRSLDADIPERTLNRWKSRARIHEESLRSDNENDHRIPEYQNNDDYNNVHADEDDQNSLHSVYDLENTDEFDLRSEEDISEDLNESIKELLKKDDKEYSEIDLYGALLSLFFSCKISQAAFPIILSFVELISDVEVPKDFNECGNSFLKLLNEQKIAVSKRWFCKSCDVEVSVNVDENSNIEENFNFEGHLTIKKNKSRRRIRMCSICNNK